MDWFSAQVTSLGLGELPDIAGAVNKLSETISNIDTSGFDAGLGLDFLPPVTEDKPAASSSSQATKARATTDGPSTAPSPSTATARASAPSAAAAAVAAKDKVQEAAVGSKTPEKAAPKPVTATAKASPARAASTAETAPAAGVLAKEKGAEPKAAVGGAAKPESKLGAKKLGASKLTRPLRSAAAKSAAGSGADAGADAGAAGVAAGTRSEGAKALADGDGSAGKDEVVKEEKEEKEKKVEKKPTKIVKLVKGKLSKPQAGGEAAAAAATEAAFPAPAPEAETPLQIAPSATVEKQEPSAVVDGAGETAGAEDKEGGAGWAIDEVLPGNDSTVPASPSLKGKPDAEPAAARVSVSTGPEPAAAEAVSNPESEEDSKPAAALAEEEAVVGTGESAEEEGEGWAAVIEEEEIVTNEGDAGFSSAGAGTKEDIQKSEDKAVAAGDDVAGAGSAIDIASDGADAGAEGSAALAIASSTPLPFSGFEAASEGVFSIDDGEGEGEEEDGEGENREGIPAPSPIKPSLPEVRPPFGDTSPAFSASPAAAPTAPLSPVVTSPKAVGSAVSAGLEAAATAEKAAAESGSVAPPAAIPFAEGESGPAAVLETSEEETRTQSQGLEPEENKVTRNDVAIAGEAGGAGEEVDPPSEGESQALGLTEERPAPSPEGAPAEGASAEGASAEGASAEGAPAEGAPAEGASAEGAPAEGAPAESAAQEGEEGAKGEGLTEGLTAAGNGPVNDELPVSSSVEEEQVEEAGAAVEEVGAAVTDANGWAVGSVGGEGEAVAVGEARGEREAGERVDGEVVEGTAGEGTGVKTAGTFDLAEAAVAEMAGGDVAAGDETGDGDGDGDGGGGGAAAAAAASAAANILEVGPAEARGVEESEGDGGVPASEEVAVDSAPPAAEAEALFAEIALPSAAAAEALSVEKAASAAAAVQALLAQTASTAAAEALSSELQAELVRVKMELANMESALQHAARQAQTKADDLARAMTVNDELRAELEDLKAQKNNDAELEALREEYQHRLGAAERKVYALTKERDMLRREQSRKADTSTLLKEKDEIIRQVMAEGEELSKKQAAQEAAMKKLRTQLREMEEEKSRLQSRLQVEEARVESIKKDKAATEKALQDAVERGQADLAAQKDFYVSALSAAREAQAAAEARADSEAKAEAERKLKEAGERERALVMTVEELRQALTRSEQQAGFREQMLRRDLEDMEKRCQAAEARHEELVARIPDSTRPLLRQIEAMQESANTRMEALSGVERALNARLQDAEAKAAVAEEKERVTSERLNQTLSRLAVMEAQLSCLRAEHSQLARSLDKERQRAAENRTEYLSAQEAKAAAEGRVKAVEEEMREVKGRWRKEVQEERQRRELVEQELESERASMAEHERKIRAEGRAAAEKALAVAHAAAGSSYPELSVRQSLRRVPSTSSAGSSAIEEATASGILAASLLGGVGSASQNDLLTGSIIGGSSSGGMFGGAAGGMGGGMGTPLGYGASSGGGLLRPSAANAAAVEHLESLLRQKDGEIATHTARLAALESTRDSLAEELVKTTTQCESLRGEVSQLPGLKAELEAIRRRHASALELMGERDEQVEELRADLMDVKEMYREQIDMLVDQIQKLGKASASVAGH